MKAIYQSILSTGKSQLHKAQCVKKFLKFCPSSGLGKIRTFYVKLYFESTQITIKLSNFEMLETFLITR